MTAIGTGTAADWIRYQPIAYSKKNTVTCLSGRGNFTFTGEEHSAMIQITKLDLPDQVKVLLNSDEAKKIVEAVEDEKKKGVTNSDTSKQRAQIYLQIQALIKQQGTVFKQETENATSFLTQLSAQSKLLVAQAEEAVVKMQKSGWDQTEAGKVMGVVPRLKHTVEEGKALKQGMMNHQGFRGQFAPINTCTAILGKGFYEQLNNLHHGFREEPLKGFMLVQDKLEKLSEYEKRGEHFASMLPALKGGGGETNAIMESLAKDRESVQKDQEDIHTQCEKVVNANKATIKSLEKTPEKAKELLTSIQESEKKLKVCRSRRNTSQQLSDGLLKKAGPIAGKQTPKDWAGELKKLVSAIDKDISTMTSSIEEVKKKYEKALKK
jgi:hypothetical protein